MATSLRLGNPRVSPSFQYKPSLVPRLSRRKESNLGMRLVQILYLLPRLVIMYYWPILCCFCCVFFLLVLMHHMQVYISGKQYHSDLKSVFAASTSDSPDSCTLVRVEGFAIYHYSNVEGWPCALHAEASSFTAMFVLLMWDVIFTSGVPDVFRTPFQVEMPPNSEYTRQWDR